MKASETIPYVIAGVDVKDGETITIIEGLSVRPKAETGFDRDTTELVVKLKSGKEKPFTANRTSVKALAAAYGDESDGWKNKKAKVSIVKQQVRGEFRDVIYLAPIEPK